MSANKTIIDQICEQNTPDGVILALHKQHLNLSMDQEDRLAQTLQMDRKSNQMVLRRHLLRRLERRGDEIVDPPTFVPFTPGERDAWVDNLINDLATANRQEDVKAKTQSINDKVNKRQTAGNNRQADSERALGFLGQISRTGGLTNALIVVSAVMTSILDYFADRGELAEPRPPLTQRIAQRISKPESMSGHIESISAGIIKLLGAWVVLWLFAMATFFIIWFGFGFTSLILGAIFGIFVALVLLWLGIKSLAWVLLAIMHRLVPVMNPRVQDERIIAEIPRSMVDLGLHDAASVVDGDLMGQLTQAVLAELKRTGVSMELYDERVNNVVQKFVLNLYNHPELDYNAYSDIDSQDALGIWRSIRGGQSGLGGQLTDWVGSTSPSGASQARDIIARLMDSL
jgi:hypothetical protein